MYTIPSGGGVLLGEWAENSSFESNFVHCSKFRCPAAILFKDDAHVRCAGISKQSMGARNRVGTGCLIRPPGYTAWRNWFLGIDSWGP
jgi:hypothetical protein